MFELTRDVIDDMIFAMEDQEGAWQIDLGTGGLIAREEACGDGETLALPRPETVAIPAWSPRDGFKLMESFASGVRLPSARRALFEALEHGRGVFKAFKERLSGHPDLERGFREKKARVMGARIREWYDDLREAQGLERLGEAPEDSSDLVSADLGYSSGLASSARPIMLGLLDEVIEEMAVEIPQALVAWNTELLKKRLEAEDWVGVWVDDGEGGAIAGAAGRREARPAFSLSRLFFIAVHKDFRRQGIARTLIEKLFEELGAEEGAVALIDSPLLPSEYERSLISSGFSIFGPRAWRQS